MPSCVHAEKVNQVLAVLGLLAAFGPLSWTVRAGSLIPTHIQQAFIECLLGSDAEDTVAKSRYLASTPVEPTASLLFALSAQSFSLHTALEIPSALRPSPSLHRLPQI